MVSSSLHNLFYCAIYPALWRGTHQLEPMKNIVSKLIARGKTVKEIGRELGMKPEEVFRLSDFTRDDFLKIMIDGASGYNRAYINQNIK